MNLKERLEAAKKALAATKAAVESGEKSAEDLQNAIKAVEDLQEKIKAAEKAETLLEGLKKPEKEPAEKEAQKTYKTVGEKVAAKMEQAKDDIKNQSFHIFVPSEKAAALMDTPSSISPALTDVDTRIVEGYRRPLLIADLFGAERISGNALTYFVESSTVEGGPA